MTTAGPVGKQRSTGIAILLAIVTLGIYALVWTYSTAKEMKDHSGTGLGGGIALLIYILVSPATFFIHPSEVAGLYRRAGQPEPVSAITGLWILLPLAGPIVWFVKVNGALNTYWANVGGRTV
ncbi:MAG: hypothetical protein JWO27_2219 [Frankiales bacterium]|jgi:hypothetical protein|nr:hypothetical protein [Frankiales bacterium]MCW2709675.1 hypothetical protein [Frankiales bacterium]